MIARTPPFDHCTPSVGERLPPERARAFGDLLPSMSYADPGVRRLFDLEGLTAWRPGRTSGYSSLDRAIDEDGFYGAAGEILGVAGTDPALDVHLRACCRAGGHTVPPPGDPDSVDWPGRTRPATSRSASRTCSTSRGWTRG